MTFHYQLAMASEVLVADIANPSSNTIRQDLINAITVILEPVLNARRSHLLEGEDDDDEVEYRNVLDTVTFDFISRGSLPETSCSSPYCVVVTSTVFILTTEREDSVKLATYGIMQASMDPNSNLFVKEVDNELVLGVFYGRSDGVPDDVCLYDCLSGKEEKEQCG